MGPVVMGTLHHSGSYRRRSAAVRAAAYADPAYRCPGPCGLTRAEHGLEWDADHAIAGDPLSPLRAMCTRCNRSAGARLRNVRAKAARLGLAQPKRLNVNPHSRTW